MSVTKAKLISTGAALKHAETLGVKKEDLAKVTIDGEAVDPVDADAEFGILAQAIDDAERLARAEAARKAEEKPGVFARAWRSVGDAASSAGGWAKRNIAQPTGQALDEMIPGTSDATDKAVKATTDLALSNPERVQRDAMVRIETRDGRLLEIPVKVHDELASQILQVTSATAGGVGLVPVIGNLVQGGTGLVAALASGASYLFGDKDLGKAFLGMAKKHLVLGLVGFVPGGGAATTVSTVKDFERINAGVRIDELVAKQDP